MTRSTLVVVLLGMLLPCAASAQDEWEQQVRSMLSSAGRTYEESGYEMTHQIHMGSLGQGASEVVELQLDITREYQILGACDNDCTDLDLTLSTGSGEQVDQDIELDDFPIVSVTVARSGTFRLDVSMATCSAEPCRYGIGVFARTGGGSPGAAASSAGSGSAPNYRAAPTYGTIELSSGFTPDPYVRSVSAGGRDQVSLAGDGCSGHIQASAPDLDLNYTAGTYPLHIYAKSSTDVTLVVNLPDGTWVCSDDVNGSNPAISLSKPLSGNYNIWIGTYQASSSPLPESTVYISENEPRW